MSSYFLEICAGSLNSALVAQKAGAHRIELCDNLAEGGTTPSYGMIKTCKSLLKIPIFPIIRPRGGDFVYSDEEFEVMKQDVLICKELGCEGVVFGILLADGGVDKKRCAELLKLTDDLQVTYHRAFDHCTDQPAALEDLIELGFDRVLTSGGKPQAIDAIPQLNKLIEQANGRITIMPGSGITEENILQIAEGTGAIEFHGTGRREGFESDYERVVLMVKLLGPSLRWDDKGNRGN